jgi:hypothetical protein
VKEGGKKDHAGHNSHVNSPFPFLTDEEILEIVKPLRQPAAILRWFRKNGFDQVKPKPNGMPLIGRTYFEQVTGGVLPKRPEPALDRRLTEPNVEALRARWSPEGKAARKAQRMAERAAEREAKKLLAPKSKTISKKH